MPAATFDAQTEARSLLAGRELERRRCRADLTLLLDQMQMVDEKSGEVFRFHLNDPESGWHWQRTDAWDVMDANQVVMFYKARQLGMTWLCAGRQLAKALTMPGTRHLVFRQREEDALEIVNRQWDLLRSLPPHLRYGVKVLKPHRGLERDDVRPEGEIELLHPDGRRSTIKALPPTGDAGHGDTVASVLVDEAARIKKLRKVLQAVMATVGQTGEVYLVSTANGVSGEEGEGNHFHWLWKNAEEARIAAVFFGVFQHPGRDEEWLRTAPEYLILDDQGRAEQYPRTPEEGFQLTAGASYFDREALTWYQLRGVRRPLYRFQFEQVGTKAARRKKGPQTLIKVFEEPNLDHTYAIAADVSSGRGRDYSVAAVINLATMAPVAELRAKIDPDELATQLHFLGRWYGAQSGCDEDAMIAIETAAGHGEAVIVPLRDGREGRPRYSRLYRHRRAQRPTDGRARDFGFKTNDKTRPQILSLLKRALREQLLPWVTSDLLQEAGSFVYADTNPSPRAADGCNDDSVLAWAIALELYRQFGNNPGRPRRTRRPRD